MRRAIPVLLLAAAAGAGVLSSRAGRSRESLLPLSRAAADHGKALDRSAASLDPMTPEEERALGAELDARLRGDDPPPGSPEASRLALWRELGGEAARSPLARRFAGRWEFRLARGGALNAFALPGGYLYATDGLLAALAGDPDAVVFVAAHELGHSELGHCAHGRRLRGLAGLPRVLAALHFSESQELEADAFAVRVLRSLRRDPRAGLRALDALGVPADARVKRGPGELAAEGLRDYLGTHPGGWERRAALEREASR